MDAMDGKHARASKQGTPLGATFDHGVDTYCSVAGIIVCEVVLYTPGDEQSFAKIYVGLAALYGFWLCQWEHYHTGILGTAGCTEFTIFFAVMMGLLGDPRVEAYARKPYPDLHWSVHDVADLFLIVPIGFFVVTLLTVTWKVFRHAVRNKKDIFHVCVSLSPLAVHVNQYL